MTTARKIEPGPNDLVFNLGYYAGEGDRDLQRYGSFWDRAKDGRYFVPEHLSFSDYSGCMVERANVKAFAEQFESGEGVWWHHAFGGHGTEAIVIDSHGVPDDVQRDVDGLLSGLHDYPSIDDELVSEMEVEGETEAWDGWVRSDFISALAERVEGREWPRDDLSDVDGGKLREAFETVRERLNLYWETETGGGRWVDVERVAAGFTPDEIRALLA